MSELAEVQRIEESLELESLDEGLFRSIRLWKPVSGRGAFGGNIIAQAANAATKTVESHFHLHSLHCYFLSFGNVDIPVIYNVERLRDGKSYCTRSVKAVQRGRSIFVMLTSFQVVELGQPKFQQLIDVNRYLSPERCLPTEVKLQKLLQVHGSQMNEKVRNYLQREYEQRLASAIEIRSIGGTEEEELDGQSGNSKHQQAIWFRSRIKVKSDPAFQKLVLAYASDFRFIGTVGRALGLGARTEPRLAMMASLDHTMWFYNNTLDVSQWMLYTMETPRAESGRGVVIGKIYTREGNLAVVCTQEGVARAELSPKDTKVKSNM